MIRETKEGVQILLHVQPRSARRRIDGVHGDAVKVRLTSPPVEGKANAELREYLASLLGVAKNDVEILKGETGRRKRVLVRGVDGDTVRKRFGL